MLHHFGFQALVSFKRFDEFLSMEEIDDYTVKIKNDENAIELNDFTAASPGKLVRAIAYQDLFSVIVTKIWILYSVGKLSFLFFIHEIIALVRRTFFESGNKYQVQKCKRIYFDHMHEAFLHILILSGPCRMKACFFMPFLCRGPLVAFSRTSWPTITDKGVRKRRGLGLKPPFALDVLRKLYYLGD